MKSTLNDINMRLKVLFFAIVLAVASVQTADAQILPQGTGYITDLGMTGVINSILGVKNEIIINRLKDNDMSRFEQASGRCMLNGCVFDIDDTTGLAKSVKLIKK